ncbi:MAG: phosphopantetheine-binding protein [Acholeplasmataceae bacterium]|jgi:acyl carrier protein
MKQQIMNDLKRIFNLVIPNAVNTDKITLESNILSDLGVNSVGIIYLAIAIEEMYDIDMGNVTFNTFKTVGDVVDFIIANK